MPRAAREASPKLPVKPATPARWPDLEKLFGPRGACGGCWCMWWKLTRADFVAGKGERNRRLLKQVVERGVVPGLVAYAGREPVGWVAIEPRDAYSRLARARVLKPVDDAPVWSITCFYVARAHRGAGVTRALVDAAVAHARRKGARLVEAYPVDTARSVAPDVLYHGKLSTFRKAGFEEVARRSRTRPIVRRGTR